MVMDVGQFKHLFIEEALGLLSNLDNTLIELEKEPRNSTLINEAFRVMHTIKGAAGMYGFSQIVEVTHDIESLYDQARQKRGIVSSELINLTFSAADHIRALLEDENFEKTINIKQHNELKSYIDKVKDVNHIEISTELDESIVDYNNDRQISTWNILFYPDDHLIKRAINIKYVLKDLLELGECQINQSNKDINGQEFFSIFLVTDRFYEEIEGALMFVMDYCRIIKLCNFNLFDPEITQRKIQEKDRFNQLKIESSLDTNSSESKSFVRVEKETIEESFASLASKDGVSNVNAYQCRCLKVRSFNVFG